MIKVSIIVPIYNVERYLRKCLDSLVNQTMEEIEIILVNDKSPDESYLIMDEYKKNYPSKITCIYLDENLSQGGARNKGIDVAKGEYILFVDSDDWVDLEICEKLYGKVLENRPEIIGCDYYNVYEVDGTKLLKSLYFNQQAGKLTRDKKASLIFSFPAPWGKLIHRDFIINNELYFPSHMKYEDFPIIPLYFILAERMEYIEAGLYYYNIRESSTINMAGQAYLQDCGKSAVLIKNLYNDKKLDGFSEEIQAMYFMQIFNMLFKAVKLFKKLDINLFEKTKDILQNIYPACKENKYYYLVTEALGVKIAELLVNKDISYIIREYQKGKIDKANVNYLNCYVRAADKLHYMDNYFNMMNYKVGLWGAGLKGCDFLKVYDKSNKKVLKVIDNDFTKKGNKTVTGHLIENLENLDEKIDIFIVANKNYYAGIKNVLKSKNQNYLVFNLELFLLMENYPIETFIE